MDCSEFIQHYSDYRDGRVSERALLRDLTEHLQACPRCMRYHVRIARGTLLLRAAGELEPSTRLRRQLRHRLAAAEPVDFPVERTRTGLLAGLLVAVAVAFALWGARTTAPRQAASAPTTLSRPTSLTAIVNPSAPFVTFSNLHIPAFGHRWRAPGATDTPLVRAVGFVP